MSTVPQHHRSQNFHDDLRWYSHGVKRLHNVNVNFVLQHWKQSPDMRPVSEFGIRATFRSGKMEWQGS